MREGRAMRGTIPDVLDRLSVDGERVAALLAGVAAGRFPPADGAVEVVPQPPGPVAAVLSFTAHHVVAADVEPAWVHARLPPGELSAPMGARFLHELGTALGRSGDSIDAVLVGRGTGAGPAAVAPAGAQLVEVAADVDHPRVARARRYRTDVRAWEAAGGAGLLVLGRGLAGRWELAFEVAPERRGRGLGRALAVAGLAVVPAGEPLFVQVAPGNVASLRAVLATGAYVPVGSELLFPAVGG